MRFTLSVHLQLIVGTNFTAFWNMYVERNKFIIMLYTRPQKTGIRDRKEKKTTSLKH